MNGMNGMTGGMNGRVGGSPADASLSFIGQTVSTQHPSRDTALSMLDKLTVLRLS